MNLRQKNKKLKQELERLNNKVVKPKYITVDGHVECLQAQIMSGFEPFKLSPIIDTVESIKNELHGMLSRELTAHIQYQCIMPGGYHDELNDENFVRCRGIVAKLYVVDRRK